MLRALALPEIQVLRPTLEPEFSVYASSQKEELEEIVFGIVDAISCGKNCRAKVVVDWKSDVDPSLKTIDQYRAQVSAYLEVTGSEQGLIVFVTSGKVISVSKKPASLFQASSTLTQA